VQLHRALSKLGWGSRNQAWDWVRAGQVQVDGLVVTDPLTWVDLGSQRITRAGQASAPAAPVTLALHKPRGVITTRKDERGRTTVYDLLPPGLPWIFPVGRLDADSEGLLILTSDSGLAVQLTDPTHLVPKTYQVTIAGPLDEAQLELLRQGVPLADGVTRPARVHILRQGKQDTLLEVILTEGRNRQVRRMLQAVGRRVRRLVRTAIGRFRLGDLEAGACRELGEPERRQLLTS
jgi:pseudouridine synthase